MSRPAPETFDYIEPLLRRLRGVEGLTEKSRGVFYIKSKAFLHFHGHPGAAVADLKMRDDWDRFPINSKRDQSALLKLVENHMSAKADGPRLNETPKKKETL